MTKVEAEPRDTGLRVTIVQHRNWHEWIELLKSTEAKHFDKRIVRAQIPVRGPSFIEGLKSGYHLIEGDPFVWFSDGTTEIPA